MKLLKQQSDFPYQQCSLKGRLERRSNDGDSFSVKLARDCYTLILASKGNYASDLTDELTVKSAKSTSFNDTNNDANSLPKIAWDRAIQSDNIIDYTFAVSQYLWSGKMVNLILKIITMTLFLPSPKPQPIHYQLFHSENT